jgi:hypothetical protein
LQIIEIITLMRALRVPGADFLWLKIGLGRWSLVKDENIYFVRNLVGYASVSNLSRVPTRRVILMEVRAELVDQSPVFAHPLDCS